MGKSRSNRAEDEARIQIGERLKQAREQLPEPLCQAKTFAEVIGKTPPELSMIERGQRPLSSETLAAVFENTGIRPSELFGKEPVRRPLLPAMQFLSDSHDLGIVGICRDRRAGLYRLVEFMDSVHQGELLITGSSLKGLKQDITHPFVRALSNICSKRKDNVSVKVILTHPWFASHREHVEQAPAGAIVREVFDGIWWCRNHLTIDIDKIKLIKAGPTCLSIFIVDHRQQRRLGLVNPYPMMSQAFNALSMIVEPAELTTTGQMPSVFDSYIEANFRTAWDSSGRSGVTETLERTMEECLTGATKAEGVIVADKDIQISRGLAIEYVEEKDTVLAESLKTALEAAKKSLNQPGRKPNR
jgi:transcriptional regulator with XRE-family HTH domain